MKRRLVLLLLLLVAGAIVNVAVAWESAVTSDVRSAQGEVQPTAQHERWWDANAPIGFAAQPRELQPRYGFGRESVLMLAPSAPSQTYTNLSVFRERFGWPSLAMEYSVWRNQFRSGAVVQGNLALPWRLARMMPEGTLPIRMVWPGFAINTMFYAFALWLVCGMFFMLRSRLRIKRGLCPKCAYDLRKRPSDSSACPECGATMLATR